MISFEYVSPQFKGDTCLYSYQIKNETISILESSLLASPLDAKFFRQCMIYWMPMPRNPIIDKIPTRQQVVLMKCPYYTDIFVFDTDIINGYLHYCPQSNFQHVRSVIPQRSLATCTVRASLKFRQTPNQNLCLWTPLPHSCYASGNFEC